MSLDNYFEEKPSLLGDEETADLDMANLPKLFSRMGFDFDSRSGNHVVPDTSSPEYKIQMATKSWHRVYSMLRYIQRKIDEAPKPTYFFGIFEGRRPKKTQKRFVKANSYRRIAIYLGRYIRDINTIKDLISDSAKKGDAELLIGFTNSLDQIESMYAKICAEDPEYAEVEKSNLAGNIKSEINILRSVLNAEKKS